MSQQAWHPIDWTTDRLDFLAWRYVDETQTAIEVLAYNYAYGKDLQAFYLERTDSLKNIGFLESSEQHTVCAKCGIDKHTPLRRDEMGGYVCLSCIDKELNFLQRQREALQKIADYGADCGCEAHTSEDCCIQAGVFCAECIARAALAKSAPEAGENE